MDKPTSIPQECVPEAVVERAAAAFARHDHEQVEWERIPEDERDYYRRVALDMLTAAQQQQQQQGGWDLKEVVCLACGDYIMPMGQVCHACSHPVSAPPSAPVWVERLHMIVDRMAADRSYERGQAVEDLRDALAPRRNRTGHRRSVQAHGPR